MEWVYVLDNEDINKYYLPDGFTDVVVIISFLDSSRKRFYKLEINHFDPSKGWNLNDGEFVVAWCNLPQDTYIILNRRREGDKT